MRQNLLRLLSMVVILANIISCTTARDEYYQVPDWLKGTLYEQLEYEGAYSEYLKCLELTGYKETFNRGGSYTLFVPTNEAFRAFYTENGYANIEAVPVEELKEIVEGLTLNYSYSKELLTEWSSFSYNWRKDARAFRKRTILKRYKREDEDQKLVVYDEKYVPLFTNQYFAYRNSIISGVEYSQKCYEYFYPEVEWTGMNLAGAHVVTDGTATENGFFFVIDKVVRPLDTLAEHIQTSDDYSLFNSLADKFVTYKVNNAATELIDYAENVYDSAYALNADFGADATMSADYAAFNIYGLACPTNQALTDYVDQNVLSMGYNSIEEVSNITWFHFLNNHLKIATANATYYPQDLRTETSQWAKIDFDNESEVVERYFASNGPFYGMSRVMEPASFTSPARRLFFDPNYRMFLYAVEKAGELATIGNSDYTVIGLSNDVLTALGYVLNEETMQFYLNGVEVETATMNAMVYNQIYVNSCDADHSVGTFGKSLAGIYAKFHDGKIMGSSQSVVLNNKEEQKSGFFYSSDAPLGTLALDGIAKVLTNSAYSSFLGLMNKAGYGISVIIPEITSNESVMLIPTNDAIAQAQAEGKLPSSETLSESEITLVKKFIRNSIIPSDLFFTTAAFDQLNLNTMQGEPISISNEDSETITIVKDGIEATTTSDTAAINNLASGGWAVHSINKVLID